MVFETDDEILWGPAPPVGGTPGRAAVKAATGPELVLTPGGAEAPPPGRRVFLSRPDGYALAEVLSADDAGWRARVLFDEAAQTFCVEDWLRVLVRPLTPGEEGGASRILTGAAPDADAERFILEDSSVGKLAAMLAELNGKLNQVVNLLYLGGEGLMQAPLRRVRLSVAGLVLRLEEPPNLLDRLEVKLLLPLAHPVGVQLCGTAVRIRPLAEGGVEAGLHFDEPDNDVKHVIIQYELSVQRKLIRKKRGFDD